VLNIFYYFRVSKVKQSLYTPWRRLRGEEVQLLLIHDLGTRWGWVVSITHRPRFTPRERTPGTHWTGGWVGPTAGMDTEARGKLLCHRRGSNLDRPVIQPVIRHYTAWANPAPIILEYHFNNYLIITHIVLPNSEPYNKLFTTTEDGHLTAETRMVYQ
jgi:hypothetical protein